VYNSAPYYDVTLQNLVVMSVEHGDFDNYQNTDAGRVSLKAIYVAQNPQAAANQGIEVVAPTYYAMPTVNPGDRVNITGSLRTRYGNTFIRVTAMEVVTPGGGGVTPVTITPEQYGNNETGAESADGGGCGMGTRQDDSQEGEPYEGSLVDVTLNPPQTITYVRNSHQFSVGSKLVVGDNFGALNAFYGDGGTLLAPGQSVTRLRGFGYYSYGCRKIHPRNADDIQISNP
jgi:hypothetical protein